MEVSDKIQVTLTTFDDILNENHIDRVRICKLDCEGAEFMILKSINADTAAKVDAFVIEYHWAGYDVQDIIRHVLSWGTHQINYAEDKYCERMILRAVRTDLLTQDESLPAAAQQVPRVERKLQREGSSLGI